MKLPGRKQKSLLPCLKVIAILTAAGSGSRFTRLSGSRYNIPKQFIKINRREVFLYSLLVFQKCRAIDEIFVTADKKYFDLIHKLTISNGITKLRNVIEGGKTRFESVKNAVYRIEAKSSDLILIHDAVRPNINVKLVEKIVEEAKKYGEVIPALALSDTIKSVDKGYVNETLNRESFRAIQTPQVFRYKVLMDSYEKNKDRVDFTDESAMVESAGYRVRIIDGLKENIKITTPEDVDLIKKFLK